MKSMIEKPITNPDKSKESLAWAGRIGLFVFSFFLSTAVIIFEREPAMSGREFVVGEPAPQTLFSPFQLIYVNEKATEDLRHEKSQAVPSVYAVEAYVADEIAVKTDQFFGVILETKKTDTENEKTEIGKLPFEISEASFKLLFEEAALEDVRKNVELLLERYLSQGVLDPKKKVGLLESGETVITVVNPETKTEKTVPVRDIPTLQEVSDSAARVLPEAVVKNRNLKNAVLDIFNAVMMPNLNWDENETKVRRRKATESVTPVQEEIKKEELVVQRGMIVNAGEKSRLDQIQKKLATREVLNKLSAVSLLVFLTYLLCFIYLLYFEKKTLLSFRSILLIQSVFLLTLVLCKIISVWPGSSPYLMPTALASLLLILLTRARLGILSAAVMTVLVAPLANFEPDLILATLLAGAGGTFAALRVRKRIQFVKVGSAVGISYFIVFFAFQILRFYPPTIESLQMSALGLANGLLITTPLLFLLLTLFESIFNLTTDITLLELSDLNHPLLKRMIVEAPGTYHHSLVVSTLAEAACEAIGANALLARVGCYFHDIGKIARAEFFTENQPNQIASKHEKLTPTMSCLVIMNHVKDGFELGRQYKLKDSILRFIPEHQGTTVIYYFYKKALDQARAGEKVNADDFRYPGPKPQSRETAVALLADSTEAASRSLRVPTPESVRQLVRKIINDKFIDGQLDECDLTLRDLHRIQESFVHNLMAIFHTRVKYPVAPESPDRPDIFEEDQFSKFRFDK